MLNASLQYPMEAHNSEWNAEGLRNHLIPPANPRRLESAAEEAQILRAGGTAAADLDRREPGMGTWISRMMQRRADERYGCDHTTVSASAFASEGGVASKAEPPSAAFIDVANSFGVRYPKLLCGRCSL